MRLQPHRLVFIDETSVNTKMVRLRGRALRGERLCADAPFGHLGTQTFIAGLRCNELTAPWVIDKAIGRASFDLWIKTQLAPTLSPRDVAILDNLAVHKSTKAAECLKRKGDWLFFLPPYSDKDGLLQAQGASACRRYKDLRCPIARPRRYL
jgi:transposase